MLYYYCVDFILLHVYDIKYSEWLTTLYVIVLCVVLWSGYVVTRFHTLHFTTLYNTTYRLCYGLAAFGIHYFLAALSFRK